jgi:hypothetical protein
VRFDLPGNILYLILFCFRFFNILFWGNWFNVSGFVIKAQFPIQAGQGETQGKKSQGKTGSGRTV